MITKEEEERIDDYWSLLEGLIGREALEFNKHSKEMGRYMGLPLSKAMILCHFFEKDSKIRGNRFTKLEDLYQLHTELILTLVAGQFFYTYVTEETQKVSRAIDWDWVLKIIKRR